MTAPSSPRRLQRMVAPGLIAGGALAAAVAVHLRDPNEAGSWGYCPIVSSTGLYCPMCGGLRAVHALTNGDLGGAVANNLLVVAVVLPLTAVWIAAFFVQRWSGRYRWQWIYGSRGLVVVLGMLIVGFTVLRNLPMGAALAPG